MFGRDAHPLRYNRRTVVRDQHLGLMNSGNPVSAIHSLEIKLKDESDGDASDATHSAWDGCRRRSQQALSSNHFVMKKKRKKILSNSLIRSKSVCDEICFGESSATKAHSDCKHFVFKFIFIQLPLIAV